MEQPSEHNEQALFPVRLTDYEAARADLTGAAVEAVREMVQRWEFRQLRKSPQRLLEPVNNRGGRRGYFLGATAACHSESMIASSAAARTMMVSPALMSGPLVTAGTG